MSGVSEEQKAVEVATTEAVAKIRGGNVVAEDGDWPDTWIETTSQRTPVEVVRAYFRQSGDTPKSGSRSARSRPSATSALNEMLDNDVPAALFHNGLEWSAVELPASTDRRTSGSPLPVSTDPVGSIVAAAQQKFDKHYGVDPFLLIIDWEGFELYDFELLELGERLDGADATVTEVWVVPALGKPQTVPSGDALRAAVAERVAAEAANNLDFALDAIQRIGDTDRVDAEVIEKAIQHARASDALAQLELDGTSRDMKAVLDVLNLPGISSEIQITETFGIERVSCIVSFTGKTEVAEPTLSQD